MLTLAITDMCLLLYPVFLNFVFRRYDESKRFAALHICVVIVWLLPYLLDCEMTFTLQDLEYS
jgi:hypothetical protein